MNLGSLIRRHRKEKKLTLKVVAEKAGISEGFLSQVENSTSSPSVDTLISISNAIGRQCGGPAEPGEHSGEFGCCAQDGMG